MNTTRIDVSGDSPYPVIVGEDLIAELPPLVAGATRVAVIHQPTLRAEAALMRDHLARSGVEAHIIEVPDKEDAKSAKVTRFCWEVLGKAGFTRSDVIVGFGGGAVTDLAGFVAATWLRGVRVVQVPTTLLGMVDAAIGGKTGINTAAGKNLVGAFHPPQGVLVDLSALATLSREEMFAGMAEVIKCGFIQDSEILTRIEEQMAHGALRDESVFTSPDSAVLRELIERSIHVKASIVSEDIRENGVREILNYGHTLGHAIEKQQDYAGKHGHAISVGMVFAAELARLVTDLDSNHIRRHRAMLSAFDLPTSYTTIDRPALLELMRVDKKARGNTLRFVVLNSTHQPAVIENPSTDVVYGALAAVVTEGVAA